MDLADRNPQHQVLADELEKDGRVVLSLPKLSITVTGLNAPPLEDSSAQVVWAREIRAVEVREFFQYALDQRDHRRPRMPSAAEIAGQLPVLAAVVQLVLELPAVQSASWWIDRRPLRHPIDGSLVGGEGSAIRAEAKRLLLNKSVPVPDSIRCTVVELR